MALAVYGKHPAKGDFLDHGVPAGLRPLLEGWLDLVLAQARADLGGDWERVWAAAPMLRFWLGEGIWGQQVCGVLVPTQDRVGRRFPLVLLALGAGVPPPVVDADQGWYDGIAAHLARMLRLTEIAGPAALLTSAPLPAPMDQPGPPEFWAMRPGAAVGELLADVALTDHRRAAAGRSYWWVAGDPPVDRAENAGPPETRTEDLPEPQPEPEPRPEPQPEPQPEPDPPAPEPVPDAEPEPEPEASPWDVAVQPALDESPFAAASGPSLFAAPLPPDASQPLAPVQVQPAAVQARGALWSQVWAGPGLPPGPVIAWFLRGHDGND